MSSSAIKAKPCYPHHGEFTEGCNLCRKWRDDPRYESLRNGTTAKQPVPPSKQFGLPCIHRGEATGEAVGCKTCRGNVQIKLLACAVHGTCTMGKRVAGTACCDTKCGERVAP